MAGDGTREQQAEGKDDVIDKLLILWPDIIRHLSIFEKCRLFGSCHLSGIV